MWMFGVIFGAAALFWGIHAAGQRTGRMLKILGGSLMAVSMLYGLLVLALLSGVD